jgi:hypothetical protein
MEREKRFLLCICSYNMTSNLAPEGPIKSLIIGLLVGMITMDAVYMYYKNIKTYDKQING